ncbi:putative lipoprotein YajG [Microbacteriaceae bacterium SG_E_30_P1]|uniref:Lipoprotein YajG n=1 Tax=Antiquaquibacter oligotrophicus TaxID=2880260 RepID=A0ABT6KPM1_9MICO|nr:hypothetical protein [Antiquaquibacter oligotrophicus]MDH6181804.1 putative lipoprotein YajG [Antiquaquibacter oligotrophicus]UDF12517.1 hypothetical protein LH407_10175 [Antiquaquibacter oligotrophicus]
MTARLLPVALVLLLVGCGATPPASTPTPTPSLSSYADCVAGVQMDPDDVQAYIDEVHELCGEPD